MKKTSTILICLWLKIAVGHAQQLSPADLKDVLTKIRAHRSSAPQVEADFQEEKRIHLMTKPIVSSGRVWFEPPDKFRREVKGSAPSVTVCDGRQLWIYYPNFKSAEHYSLGKRSPIDSAIAAINTALNLENVENTFQISGARRGNGYSLELLPRSPAMKRMFQKFDLQLNQNLFVDRTEAFQANGDRIVTTYSNQGSGPVPSSTFEFTPPAGTDVSTPLGR